MPGNLYILGGRPANAMYRSLEPQQFLDEFRHVIRMVVKPGQQVRHLRQEDESVSDQPRRRFEAGIEEDGTEMTGLVFGHVPLPQGPRDARQEGITFDRRVIQSFSHVCDERHCPRLIGR